MAGREMDAQELAAGAIVGRLFKGEAVPRDVAGAPDRTHDFDVKLPDGRCIALEVTSATKDEVQALRVAALGKEYTAPGLDNDWWIIVGEVVGGEQISIRKLTGGLVPLLAVFERHGHTEVETRDSPRYRPEPGTPQEVSDAKLKQFELGAAVSRVLGPRQASEARLYVSVSGGFTADVEKVNDLVATEAQANREKLAAAQADERHVFVWLSQTHSDVELAVFTGPPPNTPPALPAGIDVVWLGTGPRDATAERLWRVRPPSAWEVLDASPSTSA